LTFEAERESASNNTPQAKGTVTIEKDAQA